ncbi:MAG: hypothetical protein EA361_03860 [Bacteroidetes bacterium]|nr:MAG: hypothetical protein EA361_03860 [Bacteroidota bacterium]
MKMFSAKLGLVLVLSILATACEKTDAPEKDDLKKQPHEAYTYAAISEIEVPDVIESGVPATFIANYEKPTPCYEFRQLVMQPAGAVTLVSVALLQDTEDFCIQVIQQDSTEFTLTFPTPGTYYLEYSYYDEIKKIQLRVQ